MFTIINIGDGLTSTNRLFQLRAFETQEALFCQNKFKNFFYLRHGNQNIRIIHHLFTEYTEICAFSKKNLECKKSSEILLIEEAQFGRMKKSDCLKTEDNLGCHIDIIRYVRAQCSGRSSCRLEYSEVYQKFNISKTAPDCLEDRFGYILVKSRCQEGKNY